MKILQINKFFFRKGGADIYMLELSDILADHGHTVIPFAMEHPENLPTPYAKYFVSSVETERVHFGPSALRTVGRMLVSPEARKKLKKLIQHTQPDIAHVHNVYAQLPPSVLDVLQELDIPAVMTIHDYHMIAPNYAQRHAGENVNLAGQSLGKLARSRFHKDSRAASLAQGYAFKFHRGRKSHQATIDLFIAPSEFVKQEHVERGFDPDEIRVIPHFVDHLDQVPQYKDNGYILYYGRLSEEKGVEVLLRAMQEMPGVPCKIVGTGPEEMDLHILGDKMPHVTFEGYETGEGLWSLVRGARAVVIPSVWKEPFGLVATEAMAYGKPVIASDIGGLSEIVIDRVTGFLVRPGDVRDLRTAIMRLAEDPVLATQMGRAGRQRAEKRFSPETHYNAILDAYQSVME